MSTQLTKNICLPIVIVAELAFDAIGRYPTVHTNSLADWLGEYWHLVSPDQRRRISGKIMDEYLLDFTNGDPSHVSRYEHWLPLHNRQEKNTGTTQTQLSLDRMSALHNREGNVAAVAMCHAVWGHDGAGQRYGKSPYSTHLLAVANQSRSWGHLLPEGKRVVAEAVAWLHDYIEDNLGTMHEVEEFAGHQVASYTQLLVSSTGATRKERHDAAYYERVGSERISTFVKLCDRLANVLADDGSPKAASMKMKYGLEQAHIEAHLHVGERYPELMPLLEALRAELAVKKPPVLV